MRRALTAAALAALLGACGGGCAPYRYPFMLTQDTLRDVCRRGPPGRPLEVVYEDVYAKFHLVCER